MRGRWGVARVALIVGLLGLLAFALQNFDPVRVRFLVYRSRPMPLALVVLGSAVAGLAAGYALGALGRAGRRR